MNNFFNTFPAQQIPSSQKGMKWRKQHLDWADSRTYFNYAPCRNSIRRKKINLDLLNGILHMDDLEHTINPENIDASFIPDTIQHYPIMNSTLNVLRGEQSSRLFEFKCVVTNPNAVDTIAKEKKDLMYQLLYAEMQNQAASEDEFKQRLQEIDDYFRYTWQDMREQRANYLLNHYIRELDCNTIFNDGFTDAMWSGEEIYQFDIVGGEPTMRKIDPLKISVYKSGFSNKIEDADVIVIEDYWNPGRVIDQFYDQLSASDVKYIEQGDNGSGQFDDESHWDDRYGLMPEYMFSRDYNNMDPVFFDPSNSYDGNNNLLPFDINGNVRVIQMYWKSRRRIKRIKSYDELTGEETYEFYPESYIADPFKGEEEEIFFINEAWEGTKIGKNIYVNIGPRKVQYNTMSNPSRCHFGIIGTIYNLNGSKPFSLVDMMKPYNYLYDAIYDRLNKLISREWGVMLPVDMAKIPDGMDIEHILYYAKKSGILLTDSFKEGNIGAAKGKLAGALNNNTQQVINSSVAQTIQEYTNLLQYLKTEMKEVAGIPPQREGQIANYESVGGVERAMLQSTHITEWLFMKHESTKKRALECLLETAKICLRGSSKKFQYILPNFANKIVEIDGDQFSENDYGLIVTSDKGSQLLNQKLDGLAQAALQSQMISFSTMMKLFNSTSMAEKQHIIEHDEMQKLQQAQQAQEQQNQLQQQQIEANAKAQQDQVEQRIMEAEQRVAMNKLDNDTRIQVAQLQIQGNIETERARMEADAQSKWIDPEVEQAKIDEQAREFDKQHEIEKEKLKIEEKKIDFDKIMNDMKQKFDYKQFDHQVDVDRKNIQLKEKQIQVQKQKSNSNKK